MDQPKSNNSLAGVPRTSTAALLFPFGFLQPNQLITSAHSLTNKQIHSPMGDQILRASCSTKQVGLNNDPKAAAVCGNNSQESIVVILLSF